MKLAITICAGLVFLTSVVIGSGTGRADDTDDWGPMGSYGALYDTNTVATITGDVVSVKILPLGKRPGCSCVALEVNDGSQKHTAYLGPKSYIKKRGYVIDVGNRLTLTGSKVTIKGRSLVLVRDLKLGDKVMRFRSENGHHL